MTLDDDAGLLARIHRGAPDDAREALRTLYEIHACAVLALAERLLGDASDAEDALQETFLVASRAAGAFRSGSARPWLLTLCANRTRDLLRARRRRARRERAAARPEAAPSPREDPELGAALAALPPAWRAALELRFAEGLTHADVAGALGCSLRTAKEWSARGLAALRERLDEDHRT